MNIYVTNLTYTTTEDELSQLFEPYGMVESVRIITDRDTGRSRGFGFVDMPNAIEALRRLLSLMGRRWGDGRWPSLRPAPARVGMDGGARGGKHKADDLANIPGDAALWAGATGGAWGGMWRQRRQRTIDDANLY